MLVKDKEELDTSQLEVQPVKIETEQLEVANDNDHQSNIQQATASLRKHRNSI
jgi:hypothetical protein